MNWQRRLLNLALTLGVGCSGTSMTAPDVRVDVMAVDGELVDAVDVAHDHRESGQDVSIDTPKARDVGTIIDIIGDIPGDAVSRDGGLVFADIAAVDAIADVSMCDCVQDAHSMDANDVSEGADVPDAAVSSCISDDGGVFRLCRHCPVSGQLFGVYCSPESNGPCYVYPTTCVDPGFIDCQNSSMSMRYPGLRERCAAVCVQLRALESSVQCSF